MALVFARRAAADMAEKRNAIKKDPELFESVDLSRYEDGAELKEEYGEIIAEEMKEQEDVNPVGAKAEMRYEPCSIQ